MSDPIEVDVDVVLPDRPPELGPRGLRALMRILVDAAQERERTDLAEGDAR